MAAKLWHLIDFQYGVCPLFSIGENSCFFWSRLEDLQGSYDVFSISKLPSVRHLGFDVTSYQTMHVVCLMVPTCLKNLTSIGCIVCRRFCIRPFWLQNGLFRPHKVGSWNKTCSKMHQVVTKLYIVMKFAEKRQHVQNCQKRLTCKNAQISGQTVSVASCEAEYRRLNNAEFHAFGKFCVRRMNRQA